MTPPPSPSRAEEGSDAPAVGGGPGPVLGVVGDLLEDVVVWFTGECRYATDNPARITRCRGGSAANVAAMAATLATPTRFIGRVGNDPTGTALVEELAARGVDVRAQRGRRTGTVVVLVDQTGERTMFPDRAAAAELARVPEDCLQSVGVLHATSYSFAAQPAASATIELMATASAAGIVVSLDASSTGLLEDVGLPHYLELLDVIRPAIFFANAREADLLDLDHPQFAPMITVVKNGSRPTVLREPDGVATAVDVPRLDGVRDSTGAGDAFAAGFLSAYLEGRGPIGAVVAGHAMARTLLLAPGATAV
jgi:sugar/nucleoside kinase (ribokinase family)